MQAASDIFLGWVQGEGGRDFYLRQLHDMKGSVDTATIQPTGLTAYAGLCGATLARAHARGGDAIAIDAYLGTDDTFSQALEEFAQVYADQAEQDYGQLQQAITQGKIPVQTGI
jgi:L-2-hydroxyglutarate oxidase LhgO